MSTRLTTHVKRDTGLTVEHNGEKRGLEVILRLGVDGVPEISFRLKGLKSGHVISIMDAYDMATRSTEEFAPLKRPVKLRSSQNYKNGSKMTPLSVTIYPDDVVTIRQNGAAASTNLSSIWTRCQMTEAGIEMPKPRRKS